MSPKIVIFSLLISAASLVEGQTSKSPRPYNIPIKLPQTLLSGNFGELRPNHFHSGIDFKTQGTTGLPVYCYDDGYVSRIGVSPSGYGNVLYVSHPDGITTVYAHLSSFSKEIQEYVRQYQYENETFALDLSLEPDQFPLTRGQVIAKSGNSGSSAGPHLHFEIRETQTQAAMDALPYFADKIKDTKAPRIQNIYVYPIDGVVNQGGKKITAAPIRREDGTTALNKNITAWGTIGIGLKGYDYMNDTYNKYGIKNVQLYADDSLVFSVRTEKIPFEITRHINSYIDYEEWDSHRSMLMRLFIEPGNQLEIYTKAVNQGYITINEERIYNMRIDAVDAYGNKTSIPFKIKGVAAEIPVKEKGPDFMPYNQENCFNSDSFNIILPQGALYNDLDFRYERESSQKYFSDIHKAHNGSVPIQVPAHIQIRMTCDTLQDKSKYYIGLLNANYLTYLPSQYEEGVMKAESRWLGNFTVAADKTAPNITPFTRNKWAISGNIRFKISDAASGIKSWHATIDGQFAIFEFDAKKSMLSCRPERSRLAKTKTHQLELKVTDNCGNEKTYSENITL